MNIKVKDIEVEQISKMDKSKILDSEELEQVVYISKRYRISRKVAMEYVMAVNQL